MSDHEGPYVAAVSPHCRGRCTAMLEDGEAFKARARLRSVYSSEVAKGRPLLPAAVQVERMVRELVDWAAQMPLFATQLTGAGHACFGCYLQRTGWMRPNAPS